MLPPETSLELPLHERFEARPQEVEAALNPIPVAQRHAYRPFRLLTFTSFHSVVLVAA